MFCPKCGSILRPKEKGDKKVLFCSCGFTKSSQGEAGVENIETNPKIKVTCEKCGHGVAYYWSQQTRGADEPETRFFKCVKCNHTWREYA